MTALVLSWIANGQSVAPSPDWKVGDRWRFQQTTTPGGEVSKWSREVTQILPDRLQVRFGSGQLEQYDTAFNFLPEGKPDYARMLARYPMKVGNEWPLSRKFDDPMTSEHGSAKVVAYEEISVRDGTYCCCYRIEAKAVLTNRMYSETRKWVRWYCPDVKWIAREILETTTFSPYNPAANGTVTQTSELVMFLPGT